MEIHQLRYFLAVAHARNFSRAAERCHVAQPSLSQQILKLENELGEKLFERGGREVILTPAGEIFRSHAERVLDEIDDARQKIGEVRGQVRGRVALGVLPTIAPYFLPAALKIFNTTHPAIEVNVHEDTTAGLSRAIDQRELDLALISDPDGDVRLMTVPLLVEPLWLALPAGHPLARRRRLTVADVVEQPFIVMQESHCLGGQALQFCQSRGFSPRISFRSAQIETVRAFVAAGLGISLVPAMALQPAVSSGIVYRRLAEKPTRQINIIHHPERPLKPAAAALADSLRRLAPKKRPARATPSGT